MGDQAYQSYPPPQGMASYGGAPSGAGGYDGGMPSMSGPPPQGGGGGYDGGSSGGYPSAPPSGGGGG